MPPSRFLIAAPELTVSQCTTRVPPLRNAYPLYVRNAYPLYVAIMGLFAMRTSPLQALLTALVPDRLRGTLMSLAIAVGQVGTGLGASLAGVTYAGWGYRATTLLSAVVILAMAWLV